jgi:ABC-type sulfate transport system substrate-binding protein
MKTKQPGIFGSRWLGIFVLARTAKAAEPQWLNVSDDPARESFTACNACFLEHCRPMFP